MIKNFSNIPTRTDDVIYNEVNRLINKLYTIKSINRRLIYLDEKLKQLVLETEIGQSVILELKELGITRQILIMYNLEFFDTILGDEFPAY